MAIEKPKKKRWSVPAPTQLPPARKPRQSERVRETDTFTQHALILDAVEKLAYVREEMGRSEMDVKILDEAVFMLRRIVG